jgi:DNA adenine methylase
MKSPLRYPGGKQRVAKKLVGLFADADEFREPFVGGGSVFLEVLCLHPSMNIWINDLNPEVFWFWFSVKHHLSNLINEVVWLRESYPDGRQLFNCLRHQDGLFNTPPLRAARFFVLNRITFSGTIESGGYSRTAFETRFTESSILRLGKLEGVLRNVTITNCDYSELLNAPGNAFIFCDPPYCANSKGFDHDRFANAMLNCQHPWMATYDDCYRVRTLFESADIQEFSLQYGMNNVGKDNAPKGNELIIRSKHNANT